MEHTSARDLSRWALLSIGAALVTIALKTAAWLITGSVGLLSDAAESVVNLVAAVVAFVALRIAARPADDDHQFGHAKSEYFSAVIEGVMIVVAAGVIIYSAVDRLIHPQELESIGLGLALSVVATMLNGAVAWLLLRVAREHRSITLEADGKHLLTDVWTTVGVVAGLVLVALTGWLPLDSIIAIAVAVNILVVGYLLIKRSTTGLMDGALAPVHQREIDAVLDGFRSDGTIDFHDVRTREAGATRFVQLHMLVPGEWSVQRGHDAVEEVEGALRAALDDLVVTVHLEPIDDPRAYESWRR
ncbi:cation diffusion facilitator family transporter [Gordonia caeni]|uniref:Cation diffusion facilitator family transporter n=1 Tax=Gordonia caeni TaxID=1007097 RepID=A0ABP7NMR7_9ACTN